MIVTEKQINQQKTRIGVLNLVSDACRYYSFEVSEPFNLDAQIKTLEQFKSNNCEDDLILNIFKFAKNKLEDFK